MLLLQLLREVSADAVDFDRIEHLMQRNVSLVYKLLRFVNPPLFAWHSQSKSVRHAMALLGEEELRKWICLLLVGGIGAGTVPQLLVNSLVRASFAQLLCPKMHLGKGKASAFLLGLLSHLDALLHRPMEEVIAEPDLDEDLANALLGRTNTQNQLVLLYELIQAYEKPDWIRTAALAQEFRIGVADVSTAYIKAVECPAIAGVILLSCCCRTGPSNRIAGFGLAGGEVRHSLASVTADIRPSRRKSMRRNIDGEPSDKPDDHEHRCEFPRHVRGGIPLLRGASRRKDRHDDDPWASARPKPGDARLENAVLHARRGYEPSPHAQSNRIPR